ncbi:uncharacterized protein LOC131073161 [Cryptomeria japonica]|uniref:uncharacterized protein LOC131073161 n=1 Tax=Cryptomeria japonica TaxID=3369 RepID=UPI0025AB9BB0|nr:uncharacterized protein LOC131073161 [Cryptomeria japonica]
MHAGLVSLSMICSFFEVGFLILHRKRESRRQREQWIYEGIFGRKLCSKLNNRGGRERMSRGREAHLLEIEGSALSLHLGLLPNPKLEKSVLSICVNTSALAYMIPLGFGVVVSFPQVSEILTKVFSRDHYYACFLRFELGFSSLD